MRKNKKKKQPYVAPKIEVTYVKLEQGLAASSARIVPGGDNNVPTVTDWDDREVEENWNF
ncbi:hypothetical protein [Sphingobacterium bambusae]|uniref:RiPP n=1 Tax=Sphingobacterium bambusae TaxID=662858 RepID=A0ABW6BEM6_9SPHI|nr:hypothetical protein [Sphingobacterium bambusae]WPL48763.1 hypothetical protein SCB77_22695 [Sphingobacterium bambusae]